LKILFLSYWYPSKRNPLKGVFIKKHAHAIAAAGNKVHVLSLVIERTDDLFKKEIITDKDEKGIDHTQIAIGSKYYKLFHLLLFYQYRLLKKEAKRINASFQPQLIHSNVLYPAAILGYKLSNYFDLPHVITEHWSKVNKFMDKSLYAGIGKKAYAQAKKITVVSNFLKENILSHINAANTIVVPNVVNTDLFRFKEKAGNNESITISCVAHWSAPKRPDLIFNALNKFANQSNKKLILNVVGEGKLINELKSKIWLFEVNYLGNQIPSELAQTLQRSDYFLHASEIETFSIVIAEALATGTPVLASHVGAISELINSNNGFVTENTIENWVNGLEKITSRTFDHKTISHSTEKFSEKLIGEQFTQLYNEIVKTN
jgi:glycosyltransferase involved in cell wall biosynthesis